VRHNEDKLNNLMAQSAETVRVQVDMRAMDDPHTKASLLLQVRWRAGGVCTYVCELKWIEYMHVSVCLLVARLFIKRSCSLQCLFSLKLHV